MENVRPHKIKLSNLVPSFSCPGVWWSPAETGQRQGLEKGCDGRYTGWFCGEAAWTWTLQAPHWLHVPEGKWLYLSGPHSPTSYLEPLPRVMRIDGSARVKPWSRSRQCASCQLFYYPPQQLVWNLLAQSVIPYLVTSVRVPWNVLRTTMSVFIEHLLLPGPSHTQVYRVCFLIPTVTRRAWCNLYLTQEATGVT